MNSRACQHTSLYICTMQNHTAFIVLKIALMRCAQMLLVDSRFCKGLWVHKTHCEPIRLDHASCTKAYLLFWFELSIFYAKLLLLKVQRETCVYKLHTQRVESFQTQLIDNVRSPLALSDTNHPWEVFRQRAEAYMYLITPLDTAFLLTANTKLVRVASL